jgi:hypothetical protein
MADCLDLLSHGGVLQLGQLSVLVCIVPTNPGVMYSTLTRPPGNTQAAVNYMLSVSVYVFGLPVIISISNHWLGNHCLQLRVSCGFQQCQIQSRAMDLHRDFLGTRSSRKLFTTYDPLE